ncbi:MAG: hydrogenase formation protein HypD [Ignavibacteria bacterium]|nr:hydrogenase formation protein HypD [Ignavibacteria bacterium]
MKFLDEYRNYKYIFALTKKIDQMVTSPLSIMEICGGQTHTILKYDLESLLPDKVSLIHGPGCPVCVTPVELIDKAIELALNPEVILTSFGDMLRVPGSEGDLLLAKANGGNVKIVYSPLEAVNLAKENPEKKIVFFAIGFETTVPAIARSVILAKNNGIKNYYLLCANMLVPPAIEALLANNQSKIRGILAAGHVCTVMGLEEYEQIAEKYQVPIVATGFEPLDIITGISMVVEMISKNINTVQNEYSRAIRKEGNQNAKKLIFEVFQRVDREWRGIGTIPKSGLHLNDKYSDYDAEKIFEFRSLPKGKKEGLCIAGEILQGFRKPNECVAFGNECKPEHPLGAPMVSSEGACAAYFRYKFKQARSFT